MPRWGAYITRRGPLALRPQAAFPSGDRHRDGLPRPGGVSAQRGIRDGRQQSVESRNPSAAGVQGSRSSSPLSLRPSSFPWRSQRECGIDVFRREERSTAVRRDDPGKPGHLPARVGHGKPGSGRHVPSGPTKPRCGATRSHQQHKLLPPAVAKYGAGSWMSRAWDSVEQAVPQRLWYSKGIPKPARRQEHHAPFAQSPLAQTCDGVVARRSQPQSRPQRGIHLLPRSRVQPTKSPTMPHQGRVGQGGGAWRIQMPSVVICQRLPNSLSHLERIARAWTQFSVLANVAAGTGRSHQS